MFLPSFGHGDTYTSLLYTISSKKARKVEKENEIFPNFHKF